MQGLELHGLLEKRLGRRGKITRELMEKNYHTPRGLAKALVKAGCGQAKVGTRDKRCHSFTRCLTVCA